MFEMYKNMYTKPSISEDILLLIIPLVNLSLLIFFQHVGEPSPSCLRSQEVSAIANRQNCQMWLLVFSLAAVYARFHISPFVTLFNNLNIRNVRSFAKSFRLLSLPKGCLIWKILLAKIDRNIYKTTVFTCRSHFSCRTSGSRDLVDGAIRFWRKVNWSACHKTLPF